MRRDVYHYFQQACRRRLQAVPSPLRPVTQGDAEAAFVLNVVGPGRIQSVEYRCTTCMTLVALCEHVAECLQGATVEEAKALTAEYILELHPEVPPNRHARAHLAIAAARAAMEELS
jgi:NifU-like protein involved in Fe-S cluster formation